jgi:hypothetical protein
MCCYVHPLKTKKTYNGIKKQKGGNFGPAQETESWAKRQLRLLFSLSNPFGPLCFPPSQEKVKQNQKVQSPISVNGKIKQILLGILFSKPKT